jgi:hypothetical protein
VAKKIERRFIISCGDAKKANDELIRTRHAASAAGRARHGTMWARDTGRLMG